MTTTKKRIGDLGESLAHKFLERRGYTIIERNFRKPWGEIDIIAEKQGSVHFIEVKSTVLQPSGSLSRETDNRPEEHITRDKLRKLARTATLYMESKGDQREFQIDALGVIMDKVKRVARCRLFEQALEDNL